MRKLSAKQTIEHVSAEFPNDFLVAVNSNKSIITPNSGIEKIFRHET